jgi:hypothetical protein
MNAFQFVLRQFELPIQLVIECQLKITSGDVSELIDDGLHLLGVTLPLVDVYDVHPICVEVGLEELLLLYVLSTYSLYDELSLLFS